MPIEKHDALDVVLQETTADVLHQIDKCLGLQ